MDNHRGSGQSILRRVGQALKDELSSGHYPQGSKFPSEYDLANRFGINKTTANRVVAQLVQEGYLERGSKGMGTRVRRETIFPVGQVAFLGNVTHHHTSMVYSGAAGRLLESGYLLTLLNPVSTRVQEYLDNLDERVFHGVLTMNYGAVFSAHSIPIIHVDQAFPGTDPLHHFVATDSSLGAYELMTALYAAGHREIAVFLTDISLTHLSQPQQGFLRAMQEHGCTDARKRFFYGQDGCPDSIVEVLPKIMEAYPSVSAIVTENDNDALSVLLEGSKTVPDFLQRVQVTGIGGLRHASGIYAFPTVDLNFEGMGAVAAEKLLEMIEHGVPEQPLRCMLEAHPINLELIRTV